MDGRARVAWNLRRLRSAREVTQEALAFDAGVDRTYVSGIENGGFNPTVDLLQKLATTLDADIADFFRQPEPGEEAPRPLRPGRRSSKA